MTVEAPATAPLVLTMGEPAGIGPEIAVRAWQQREAHGLRPFFVLGDPAPFAAAAALLSEPTRSVEIVEITAPAEATAAFDRGLPVLLHGPAVTARPGRPERGDAEAVLQSIRGAVDLCRSGDAAAVVTNPIQKASLYAAGFHHPGHTEFLAELCGLTTDPVMMLACPGLRTVPVTIHVPLRQVFELLTVERIVHHATVTARALERDFGIAAPRLALSGLNPHAGEGGSLGGEDQAVIVPAVERLRAAGIDVRGPLPADSMFGEDRRASYDAAVCMYHDQALIPVKALGFDTGANITLGLPIVRTSPDHGTALDLAGKGVANPGSLLAALACAGEIAARRTAARRTAAR